MNQPNCLGDNCPKVKILLNTFWIKFFIECGCLYEYNHNQSPTLSLLAVRTKLPKSSNKYPRALYTVIEKLENLAGIPIIGKWLSNKIVKQILVTNREISPFLYGIYIFHKTKPKILKIVKSNLNLIKKEDIAVILSNLSTTTHHSEIVPYWAKELLNLVSQQ